MGKQNTATLEVDRQALQDVAQDAAGITDPEARGVMEKFLSAIGIHKSATPPAPADADDTGDEDADDSDDADEDDDEDEDEEDDAPVAKKTAKSLRDDYEDDLDELDAYGNDDVELEDIEAGPILKAIADHMETSEQVQDETLKLLKGLRRKVEAQAQELADLKKSIDGIDLRTQEDSALVKAINENLDGAVLKPSGTPRLNGVPSGTGNSGVLKKGLDVGTSDEDNKPRTRFGLTDEQLTKGLHALLSDEREGDTGISPATIANLPRVPLEKRPKAWYDLAAKELNLPLDEDDA